MQSVKQRKKKNVNGAYGDVSERRGASLFGTLTAMKLPSAVKINAVRFGEGPQDTALMFPCFHSAGLL